MSLITEHVFTLDIGIGQPREVGAVPHGYRRVIPITGGTVHGPKLTGTVLPGGADWNLMRTDGAIHVWARYEIETDDGSIVSIINEGLHHVDREAAAASGTAPTLITVPRFEVAAGGPTWLNTGTFVGELRQMPGAAVQVTVHQVLSE